MTNNITNIAQPKIASVNAALTADSDLRLLTTDLPARYFETPISADAVATADSVLLGYSETPISANSADFAADSGPSGDAVLTAHYVFLGILAKFASLTHSEQRFALQSEAARLLPDERVAKCLRKPVPGLKSVVVMHSPGVGAAHYKNLMVCGSVWMCPVCVSKITERRREELAGALAASDLSPILITYTLRHQLGDAVETLVDAELRAFRDFKGGAGFQAIKERYDWAGSIRALENTFGDNGFHPHLHELALLWTPLEPAEVETLEAALNARWGMVLKRHGMDSSWDHRVKVKARREDVGEYIAKYGKLPESEGWTQVHELTKAPSKLGRKKGLSMLQLLARSLCGDAEAGPRFTEYAKAFKGKQQLVWAKGTRALLGMGAEVSDEALAAEEREPSVVLLYLTLDQWHVIVANDCRAELLQIASAGDRGAVVEWLAGLGVYVYDDDHFGELIPLPDGVGVGVMADEF